MLACVVKRNPYFKTGTWVECFDQGCIQVEVATIDGRLKVIRDKSQIYIPKEKLAPFMMTPLKKGLDK